MGDRGFALKRLTMARTHALQEQRSYCAPNLRRFPPDSFSCKGARRKPHQQAWRANHCGIRKPEIGCSCKDSQLTLDLLVVLVHYTSRNSTATPSLAMEAVTDLSVKNEGFELVYGFPPYNVTTSRHKVPLHLMFSKPLHHICAHVTVSRHNQTYYNLSPKRHTAHC